MRTIVFAIAAILVLAGCVSDYMEQYRGKNIEQVVLSEGPPFNVLDLSDGSRAFQYYWGGGTYISPSISNTQISSYAIGSSVYAYTTTLTSPATIVTSQGCLVSYITTWNGTGWIVTDINFPNRIAC